MHICMHTRELARQEDPVKTSSRSQPTVPEFVQKLQKQHAIVTTEKRRIHGVREVVKVGGNERNEVQVNIHTHASLMLSSPTLIH